MRVEAGIAERVVVAASSYCRLTLGSLRMHVAHVTHSVLPHTSLQPLPFVFDSASSSFEESPSLSSSSSLAFPDLLQLGAGKVVKLGVLRQLIPGFALLDVLHVNCDV